MRLLPPFVARAALGLATAAPAPLAGVLAGALLGGTLALAPAAARAQTDQTGLLRGTVTGPDGRPLAGVTVSVAQPDGSYGRTVQTGADGTFRINFLTPGAYVARARLVGFRPLEVRGLVLRATQVTPLAVRLERALTELAAVQVTASPVAIQRATNEVANTTLGERERELLPTPRNANDLIQFTPGGRAGGVASAQLYGGSGDQANLWQLDGVSANQPGRGGAFLLPNVDWVQSIEVRGLGAGAEYGNFQGGLINIVTKSGSNTRQGAIRGFYENQGLNSSNINAFEQGSQLANRYEVNAEVRGPLVRDRLYYYLSGQDALVNTQVVDASTSTGSGNVNFLPLYEATRNQRALAKLTWQAAANDVVNASLGYVGARTQRSGLSAFDGPEATYRLRQPTAFYNLSYQRTFTSRTFLEAKLSGYQGKDDQLPYNGSGVPAVKILGAAGQFRNSFYTRHNRPGSTSALLSLDTYRTLAGMEHHLKAGGEYNVGTWRERRTRNGNLTWYYAPRSDATRAEDASAPANWQDLGFGDGTYATTDWGGEIDLNARVDNGSAWLQDYIAVTPRLSVAPGLRFGAWTGYLTPGNGGGSRGTDRFKAVSTRAVDPRLGVNFDALGDNSLVLKGHWGRYRQSLFALMFDRAPGGNVFTNVEYYDWKDKTKAALPELGRAYTAAERAQLFDAAGGSSLFAEADGFVNYRQPYMDQATLGLEKALGARHRLDVVYVNRRNRDVLSLVDRNLANNWTALSNVAVTTTSGGAPLLDQNGRPLVLPTLYVRNDDLRARLAAGSAIPGFTAADTARLTFDQDLVVTTVPSARRRFDQLQLQLTGAYPRGTVNVAVALTRLRGNVFSVNGYDNPLGQGAGPFVTPNGQINFDGNLDNYSPVDVKVRASGRVPFGFEGGAFLTLTSGDRYTPTFAVDRRALTFTAGGTALPGRLFLNTDGQGLYIAERGSERLPALAQLDLRLQRPVPVRGSARAIVGLEAFNVFNSNTVTARKTDVNNVNVNQPSTAYGAPTFRQFPRTLRLNTQLVF